MSQPWQEDGFGLPEDFAQTLRSMWSQRDNRLAPVVCAAYRAGWTQNVLAAAMGVSRSRAGQLAKEGAGTDTAPGVDIPSPPARKKAAPRPRAVPLTDEEADHLRSLRQAMRDVNARTDTDAWHTARDAYLAELGALSTRGVRTASLEQALGVGPGFMRSELAGVRKMQAKARYLEGQQ